MAVSIGVGSTRVLMPQVGLGVWKAATGVVEDVVYQAILAGYRHFDCAADYGNEAEVGRALRRALTEKVCGREDLFITSKLWNTYHRPEHVEPACRKSLEDLGLDYLDLYLIHFPIALKFVPFETRYPPEWVHDPAGDAETKRMILDQVPYQDTWRAMELLSDAGLCRNIGVSNLTGGQLLDVLSYARIPPAVNQVEVHPWLQNRPLVEFCQANGVQVTAYSPLGALSYQELGNSDDDTMLTNEVIGEIAEAHGKTRAQVVLKFHLQRDMVVIPKTTNKQRLAENLAAAADDLVFSDDELERLKGLDAGRRFNDPAVYTKFMGMPAGCPIFD